MDSDSWNEAEVNFCRRGKHSRRQDLDYLKNEAKFGNIAVLDLTFRKVRLGKWSKNWSGYRRNVTQAVQTMHTTGGCICVILLLHTCGMTQSYAWHDSSYVWHDPFIRVAWLCHARNVTHLQLTLEQKWGEKKKTSMTQEKRKKIPWLMHVKWLIPCLWRHTKSTRCSRFMSQRHEWVMNEARMSHEWVYIGYVYPVSVTSEA